MAYTGNFLQSVFSGGANRHKLITSFTQTTGNLVTISFKSTGPQKLFPPSSNDWPSGHEWVLLCSVNSV